MNPEQESSMVSGGGAVEVIEPYWRLDEPNYYRNVGTDNAEYIKLYQQAGFNPTNTPVAQQDWHFRMSDLNSYYLMSQSFFEFSFSITDLNPASDPLSQDLIYPSDMRCIFKNVQLDLNSVAVEANNQNAFMFYNVDRAFMSRQYIETAGSLGGMFLHDIRYDKPFFTSSYASLDVALSDDVAGAPTPYNGLAARLQTYTKKRTLLAITPGQIKSKKCVLCCDMPSIFQFYRYWTRCHKGIDVQCRFTTVGDTPFITNRTSATRFDGTPPVPIRENVAPQQYRMDWEGSGIVWWVRSLKPSPRVEASLNAMLQRGQEIFTPFEQAKVYNFQPQAGNQSYRIVNEASRPMRMIVGFQRKTVQTSCDDISILQMPKGLTTFSAFVNGKKVPNLDIQLTAPEPPPHQGSLRQNGDANVGANQEFDFTELYHRFLLLTGTYNSSFKNNYSKGSGAHSYPDWASISPFVCFDMSTNALGDISGSNSEIVLNYNHVADANPGITPITDYTMYCVVWTERTVSFNLGEATTYVAIR